MLGPTAKGTAITEGGLLVVAGPNGAGKTTITERGLAHEWFHDCEYVNPDAIAQDEPLRGTWTYASFASPSGDARTTV